MSTERDVDRIVRSWMEEGVTALPDHVLDAVLDQLPATPQRRATWWRVQRYIEMNKPLVIGLVTAAAILVVALVGLNLGPGSGPAPGGEPSATPASSSTAEPTSSGPAALPIAVGQPIDAATYALANFPVGITLTVPENWKACSESFDEQGVCYWPTGVETAGQVAFLIVENVVEDPCAPQASAALLDPPVGPSVDDLVTAITGLAGFETTAPVDIEMDGYAGKEFTLTAPAEEGCGSTWATQYRTTGVGPGSTNLIRILDVEGVRVMIAVDYNPDYLADFQQVLDTVQIEP